MSVLAHWGRLPADESAEVKKHRILSRQAEKDRKLRVATGKARKAEESARLAKKQVAELKKAITDDRKAYLEEKRRYETALRELEHGLKDLDRVYSAQLLDKEHELMTMHMMHKEMCDLVKQLNISAFVIDGDLVATNSKAFYNLVGFIGEAAR